MALNFHEYQKDLLFIPLGGLNEIGMNLALYTIEDKWIMVDCGIGFADDYLPGVDVVVPDIEFLLDKKDKILGLVLTHAHEDHIGAIPYLWNELQCTMYATPFTAALVKRKLAEEGLANKAKVIEISPGGKQALGPFEIEMIPITHSIPEMQGLAIRTSVGVVMHTGDWKLDPDPLVGPTTDEATLQRYGDEGVLAMVCDSTNVFVEGTSGSEAMVRKNLVKAIKACENRVAVTTFASNIARIETIILAAEEAGRHVALAGRSLWRVIEAAKEAGYLTQITKPFLTDKDAMKLDKSSCLIICTGCQGEPLAALSKMARGEHPQLRLSPADTVIFSSRKIPGNEIRIGRMQNQFIEAGIEVIIDDHDIHVSGHPARDELKRMYELIRPQISLPVHGERRHLHEHAKFASALGVPKAIEGKNGSVIMLSKEESGVIGQVHSGYMAVDGTSLIPTDSVVIKTRRKLRDDGIIIAALAVDDDGGLCSDIKISAPGCLDSEADHELIDAIKEVIEEALEKTPTPDTAKLTEAVRLTLRRMIKSELGKKPVIEVQLLRV